MVMSKSLTYFSNLHSLFWKIFISFWLATILILVCTAGITILLVKSNDRHKDLRVSLDLHTEAGYAEYENGGEAALKAWLQEHQASGELVPYWVDEDRQDILNRQLPKIVRIYFKRKEHILGVLDPDSPIIVSTAKMYDGKVYTVSLVPSMPGGHHPRKPQIVPLFPHMSNVYQWVLLLVAIIITGFVSLLLVRYHIVPIRKLQKASHQIASGELDTQVDESVSKRKDELGLLARDFNAMTSKLGSLISGQQRMLGDISHELRSPLARLRVALEIARKKSQGAATAELDRMELECERLDLLIEEILSFVRLGSGQDKLHKERFNLTEMLRGIIDDARYESHGSNVTIEFDGISVCEIFADKVFLHRALENVIRNAVKYTEQNSSVNISLLRTAESDCRVIVKDHGPGVPEETLTKIFEPFYRVSDARERSSGGHGLGLAIASRVVELHGGETLAYNEGDGFVVELVLPGIDRENGE